MKYFTQTCFITACAFSALLVSGNTAVGADCNALRAKIVKEKRMIQKRDIIRESLKECPNDPVINYEYGYSFERFRKYEDALKYYEKAISSDKKFAKGYFGKGDVQAFLGNYKSAIEAYEAGLRIEPDEPRVKKSLETAKEKYKAQGGVVEPPKKTVTAAGSTSPSKTVPKKVIVAEAPKKPAAPVSYAEAPILRLQVPFYKKTTKLSRDAMDQLDIIVGQALEREDMKYIKLEIVGHTDNTGKAADNMELSKKRAEVVKKYLMDNFKIGSDTLSIAYHGQNRPKLPNTSTQNRIANRRVEFGKIN